MSSNFNHQHSKLKNIKNGKFCKNVSVMWEGENFGGAGWVQVVKGGQNPPLLVETDL